jgi:hypothetical protein
MNILLDDDPSEPALFGASGPGVLTMPTPSASVAGPTLRTARERMGMSIDDVAEETRIAIRHLSAIEEGRYDGFAAPVYAMGFARSYAEAVGVPRQWITDCLKGEVATVFAGRERCNL